MIGFRSMSPWKMIVSVMYYSLCFLGFKGGVLKGVAILIFFANLPIVIVSVYESVRYKKFDGLYTIPVWLVAVALSLVLYNWDGLWEDKNIVATENPVATQEPVQSIAADETAKTTSDKAEMVYVTRSGGKYHKPDCRFIKGKEAIPVSATEAQDDGKQPCGVCSE